MSQAISVLNPDETGISKAITFKKFHGLCITFKREYFVVSKSFLISKERCFNFLLSNVKVSSKYQ